MKAICITDIHGRGERLLRLPPADLLLAGGDLTHFGSEDDIRLFLRLARSRFPRVLAVLGNCDPPDGAGVLEEEGVLAAENGTPVPDFPVTVWGVGGSNRTPSHTPFEWDDAVREAAFSAATAGGAGNLQRLKILISHAPPAGCPAGQLAALGGRDVGSRAIAARVRGLKPDLVLCGHLHESRGQFTLDSVPVVNPGALREGWFAVLEWRPGAPPALTLERLPDAV